MTLKPKKLKTRKAKAPAKATEPKTTKITIWTYGHRPFVMGGAVDYPMGTEVEADGPHDLGKGYTGYLVTAPNGKTFVAESETGAIVGADLDFVRNDIKESDPEVVKKQIAHAREELKRLERVTPEQFWTAMRCAT
jgi:glycine/D-amino acid oxidase-like deaminating enzyme